MTEFTQTSHESYDQHYYVLHLAGGGHTVWDDYEELRDHWFLNCGWGMSYIEARDRAKPKKERAEAKGF